MLLLVFLLYNWINYVIEIIKAIVFGYIVFTIKNCEAEY